MADFQERDRPEDISATPEPKPTPDIGKIGKKKKKKKRGCGFFLVLLLLIAGAAAGLQASGGVDLRPYVYPIVPKIPKVGPELAKFFAIPEVYALNTTERRTIELDEWEAEIAKSSRTLDQRLIGLSALSDDLSARERELELQRQELATRLEALSSDMAERDIDMDVPSAGGKKPTGIEETIRTFQDMSPRNAASILEKLNPTLAVTILDGLPQDTRGTLLGRMEAETAARLTEQLTELQKRKSRSRAN
jgi:flagellar motility protein MotE (MotC chaperone)